MSLHCHRRILQFKCFCRHPDDFDEDAEDEDEVYCDIDNDPRVVRRVFELEGQDMDEDEEAAMSDGEDSEPGLALKPHGWSEGRDEKVLPHTLAIL